MNHEQRYDELRRISPARLKWATYGLATLATLAAANLFWDKLRHDILPPTEPVQAAILPMEDRLVCSKHTPAWNWEKTNNPTLKSDWLRHIADTYQISAPQKWLRSADSYYQPGRNIGVSIIASQHAQVFINHLSKQNIETKISKSSVGPIPAVLIEYKLGKSIHQLRFIQDPNCQTYQVISILEEDADGTSKQEVDEVVNSIRINY